MRKARAASIRPFYALIFLPLVCVAGWGQGADGLYQAGRKAFQDGLYPMASRNFQSLVDQYPDSALADDAEYLRAVADFYSGEYRRSIATLAGFERKFPRSPNLRRTAYWLGAAYYHLGQDREAIRFLDRQIEGFPDEQFYADHALLLRALALERLSRWDEAAEGMRQVLSRPSAGRFHAEALFRLGGIQLRTEEFSAALTSFSRLIVEFAESAFADEARFYAAEAVFFTDRASDAERRYRSLLSGSPRLTVQQQETCLYRLALILSRRGAQGEALSLCAQLERDFPGGQYRLLLPRLKADLLFDLGRHAEASAAYRQALASADDPAERQALAYNLGLAAELGGNPSEAAEAFRLAAAGSGSTGEQGLYRLGTVLAGLQRDEEAAAALRDFDSRYPTSPLREEAARLLAFVYKRAGRLQPAEELYSRLLAHYPSSAHRDEYLFGRATVRLAAGDNTGALKDFFSLTEQLPGSSFAPESRYHQGYVYSQRGEYARAMQYFAEVLDPPPGSRGPAAAVEDELRGRTILAAGVCAFNAGDYAQAVRWFSRNTDEAPSGTPAASPADGLGGTSAAPWAAESWLYLGRAYYKLDRLEEASRGFAAAAGLLRDPVYAEEALFWLGLCQFRLNRLAEAKRTFLETARRFPNGTRTVESLYRAGACASQEQRFTESLGYFDRALSALQTARDGGREYLATLEQEILYQKGWSAFRTGERTRALSSFEALAGSYPDSTLASEAFFKLAEEDFRTADMRRALEGFLQVRERFPRSEAAAAAQYWAGVCFARLGQTGPALEHLLGYLESREGRQGALRELAAGEIRALLQDRGGSPDDERVIEAFYRRAEASPDLPQELKNQVLFEHARALLDTQPGRALPLLDTLRGSGLQEPLRGEVAYLTGEHYRRSGELDRAREIFVGIVAASAGQSAALAQLGIARILEARNRKVEAAEEYLKVYFLYPDFSAPAQEGLFQAGRVYWEQGNRQKGKQLFEKLAAEFPGSSWLDKRPDR